MASVLCVDRTLASSMSVVRQQCHDLGQLRLFAVAMDLSPETFGLLPEPYSAAADGASFTDRRWSFLKERGRSTSCSCF